MNSKPARLADCTAVVLLFLICLTAVISNVGWNRTHPQIGKVSAHVRWDFRDHAEYIGWRLGFCQNPPFVYYADEIQRIQPESTILADEGNTVGERPAP
jgi:hypothetical protein